MLLCTAMCSADYSIDCSRLVSAQETGLSKIGLPIMRKQRTLSLIQLAVRSWTTLGQRPLLMMKEMTNCLLKEQSNIFLMLLLMLLEFMSDVKTSLSATVEICRPCMICNRVRNKINVP